MRKKKKFLEKKHEYNTINLIIYNNLNKQQNKIKLTSIEEQELESVETDPVDMLK